MKFKIRFADQIVGLVIILALASLVFVIVMLGQAQRWFAKDMDFSTVLSTAGGISKNMAVQYKGFTIGNVKDFRLNDDDNVEVIFTIHEDYTKLAKQGSIVELQVGIISLLGSQFLFHPGIGEPLADGAIIPLAGTAQANEYIRQNMATLSPSEDAIGKLLSQVDTTLSEVNLLLAKLNEAVGPGTDATEIGQMIGSIKSTLASVEDIPQILDNTVDGVIDPVLAELRPLLGQVDGLLAKLNEPGGVLTVLGIDGGAINESLGSLPGLVDSINNTVAPLPTQLPGLLAELRTLLRSIDDVMVGLANNPLLKGGVPERPVTQTTGPRNIGF